MRAAHRRHALAALRLEFRAYLAFQLETAKTLGLDHVGLPISSDAIESLFGVAKHHGVGQTRMRLASPFAYRLYAVFRLGGSRAGPSGQRGQTTKDDRSVHLFEQAASSGAGHPERLESLHTTQGVPHVELIPSPKNRSNDQNIVHISNG